MTRGYVPASDAPCLIHMEDNRFPLVFFEVLVFGGSYDDPPGLEGLADLTALNLLRGTTRRSHAEVMDGFNDLGASVDVTSHREYISISGDFMPRCMEPFTSLLCEVLSRPAFPVQEFRKERALALEDIRNLVNDDAELARQHFHRYIYGDRLDGRPSSGWFRTVSKISVQDCRDFYQGHFVSGNVAVVLAGAISRELADDFASRVVGSLRTGPSAVPPEVDDSPVNGGRILIVDKPGRNQAQVVMGHPSAGWNCADLFALLVGNTAFGGTFTSRLVDEIREKRGWSYGVSSSIFAGRTSGTLMMRFFPENRDLAPAIELVEKLFSSTAFGGLSADEVDAARKYLIRQYPFRIETVRKRADELVADLVFGRPAGVMSRFVELVSSQDGQAVNQSLGRHFRPADLSTVLVGTAAEIRRDLVALAGAGSVDTVDYRSE